MKKYALGWSGQNITAMEAGATYSIACTVRSEDTRPYMLKSYMNF